MLLLFWVNKRKIPASKEAQIKVVQNKLTNKKMPVSCQVEISTTLRKIKQCKVTHFPMDSTDFHLITVDMSDGYVRIMTLQFLHMLKISNIKIRKAT